MRLYFILVSVYKGYKVHFGLLNLTPVHRGNALELYTALSPKAVPVICTAPLVGGSRIPQSITACRRGRREESTEGLVVALNFHVPRGVQA